MQPIECRSHLFSLLRCAFVVILLLGHEASAKGGERATLSLEGGFVDTGVRHRQDFCDIYNGQFDVKSVLRGREIHPVIQYGPGFVWFNYTEEGGIDPNYPGLIANILDEVAERAGFTWRQSFGVYNSDEKPEDKTWTELLELYADVYDISIDKWIKSTERLSKGLAFVDSWFDADLIIVHKEKPTEGIDLWGWTVPFDKSVWLITIATIIFSALVYQIIEYLGGDGDGRSLRKWSMDNIYLSVLNFTQNYSYEPRTLGGKIFGISFSLWGMLIGATYTANLAAFLIITPERITVISTLAAAADTKTNICIHGGSLSDELVRDEFAKSKLGLDTITKMLKTKTSPKNMYFELNEENPECKILVGTKQEYREFQVSSDTNPDCDIEWVGRTIRSGDAGFVTKIDPEGKCSSIVHEVFNYYLSELQKEGELDRLWREHYGKIQDNNCGLSNIDTENEDGRRRLGASSDDSGPMIGRELKGAKGGAAGGGAGSANYAAAANGEDDDEVKTMNIRQMAGTFFIHFIGSLIAIAVSLLSKQEKKMNVKRHSSKMTDTIDTTKEELARTQFSNGEIAGQLNTILLKINSLERKVERYTELVEANSKEVKGSMKATSLFNGTLK